MSKSGVSWSSGDGGKGIMLLLYLAMMTIGPSFAAPSTYLRSGTNNSIFAYRNQSRQENDHIQLAAAKGMIMAFENTTVAEDKDLLFGMNKMLSDINRAIPKQDWPDSEMKAWLHKDEESFAVKHPEWQFTKNLYGLYGQCLQIINICNKDGTECINENACDVAFEALQAAEEQVLAIYGMQQCLTLMCTYKDGRWVPFMDNKLCDGFASTLKGYSCQQINDRCIANHKVNCLDKVLKASSDRRFTCGRLKLKDCQGSFHTQCIDARRFCIDGLWIIMEHLHWCHEILSDPCSDNSDISDECWSAIDRFHVISVLYTGEFDDEKKKVAAVSQIGRSFTSQTQDIIDGTCYLKQLNRLICSQQYEYAFTTTSTTAEPTTTTPPPIRCGVWSEAKSNVEELLRRRDHVKFNGRMLRTFDFGGDIMIHASYSQGGYFPIMFNQKNPVLELEVCQDANSTCTDSTAMPGIVFSIEFTELPGNPMCFVPEFTESELGNDGACRKATMELTNIESPRQNMQVNFGGKEDYENCNMTLKIQSEGIERCDAYWGKLFYNDNTHNEIPIECSISHTEGMSQTSSLEDSEEFNSRHVDSWSTIVTEKPIEHLSTWGYTTVLWSNMKTIDLSLKQKSSLNINFGMFKVGASREIAMGFKKEWGDEAEKQVWYEKGEKIEQWRKFTQEIRLDQSRMSVVRFSMTNTRNETKTVNFTLHALSEISIDQLVISCRGSAYFSPFYRSYNGLIWDPKNTIPLPWSINVTSEPTTEEPANDAVQKRLNIFTFTAIFIVIFLNPF